MLIVAGHLTLDPADRDAHLAASRPSIALARAADGCLDFAVSPDPLDAGRVNVLERWASPEHLAAFRASGEDDDGTADVFARVKTFAIEQFTVG